MMLPPRCRQAIVVDAPWRFPVRARGRSGGLRGIFLSLSVRQRVEDNVDPHRVGLFLREFLEIPFVFTLTFPSVAEVGVETDDAHHAVFIVEDPFVLHRL